VMTQGVHPQLDRDLKTPHDEQSQCQEDSH
jgi:hypothetical protein